MKSAEEFERENSALRERLSGLSGASLRINESLDLDTVLQGVLDSACGLTEARYGVLAHFDETGDIQTEDALTFGMKPAETAELWNQLTGSEYCDFFEQLPGPTRLGDLQAHFESLGLPGFTVPVAFTPPLAFLGVVLRYAGESFGAIYLVEKQSSPEFTSEDEETLVMFASQAALVIANARKHQDELRARADLETLIDTSPVGVVVLEANTGMPVSFNREAKRIIDALGVSADSPEKLMRMLRVRQADGTVLSLQELPLAQVLQTGETVRAEEVAIQEPGGREVKALVNASPIRSRTGTVETFVVTMQDMAPLEELERLRAEFLGLVSHELQTPLAAIKGSATTLTEAVSDLDHAEMLQFFRIITDQTNNMRELIVNLLDVARIETGTLPVDPEPSDVRELVDEARSRFQQGGGGNSLQTDIPPDLPPVITDRRRIVQVLVNLLSNAARHSHQSSPIRVEAARDGVHVAISVSDDGAGIASEQLPLLFRKFSRVQREGQRGDTGLGLAICKGIVEAHGGRIWAESDGPGLGSRFTFTIPAGEATRIEPAGLSARSGSLERRHPRILCVDDDPQTLRYVRNALSEAGYNPVVTADPEDVLRLILERKPHLILLDLVLPGTDSIELMTEIRRTVDVPIIFLSVYGEEEVVAKAFDMGAADYVVKPFSTTELTARIKAALRRRAVPEPVVPSEPYVSGNLTIDYADSRVTVSGRPVELTPIEYQMLVELSVSAGRVLTNLQLLQRVWGYNTTGGSGPVRNIIKRLRRKLGDDAANPTYIFNEPRVGYRMPEADQQET